jgi:hypothetical protein
MRAILVTFAVISVFLVPSTVHCEEASPEDAEVVPLEQGERAPFSGQLFPTELAIRMGFRIEHLELQLQADVQRERDSCEVRLSFEERRLQLEEERNTFEVSQLTERVNEQAEDLYEARNVPWYRTWGFAFGMGIAASVVLVVGSVILMVAVT